MQLVCARTVLFINIDCDNFGPAGKRDAVSRVFCNVAPQEGRIGVLEATSLPIPVTRPFGPGVYRDYSVSVVDNGFRVLAEPWAIR
jgi:hypothetical protein